MSAELPMTAKVNDWLRVMAQPGYDGPTVNASQAHLLKTMAWDAGSRDRAWSGHQDLANRMRVSTRRVGQLVAECMALGLLDRLRDGGNNRRAEYRLVIPQVEAGFQVEVEAGFQVDTVPGGSPLPAEVEVPGTQLEAGFRPISSLSEFQRAERDRSGGAPPGGGRSGMTGIEVDGRGAPAVALLAGKARTFTEGLIAQGAAPEVAAAFVEELDRRKGLENIQSMAYVTKAFERELTQEARRDGDDDLTPVQQAIHEAALSMKANTWSGPNGEATLWTGEFTTPDSTSPFESLTLKPHAEYDGWVLHAVFKGPEQPHGLTEPAAWAAVDAFIDVHGITSGDYRRHGTGQSYYVESQHPVSVRAINALIEGARR